MTLDGFRPRRRAVLGLTGGGLPLESWQTWRRQNACSASRGLKSEQSLHRANKISGFSGFGPLGMDSQLDPAPDVNLR